MTKQRYQRNHLGVAAGEEGKHHREEEKGRKTSEGGVTEFQFRSFRASAHNQRETGVESEPVQRRGEMKRDGERQRVGTTELGGAPTASIQRQER